MIICQNNVYHLRTDSYSCLFRINSQGLVEHLPNKLQQAVAARWENPAASLTELAAMMEPPITKPAMNHRLKKLVAMAKEKSL